MKTILRSSLSLGILLTLVPPASEAQWVHTNGPYGGQVYCLAVSGSDLLAGNYGSGLSRSTDDGSSWNRLRTGFPDSLVKSLVVSGSCLFASVNGGGGGVIRSTDGGLTWTSGGAGNNYLSFLGIGFVGQGGLILFASTGVLTYRSTDSAATWTPVLSEGTYLPINSLVSLGSDLFAASYNAGVFSSPDGGATWVPAGLAGYNMGTIDLLANQGKLLAGTSAGLYTSTDNGLSWSRVDSTSITADVSLLAGNGDTLYATSTSPNGLIRSTDAGLNWSVVSTAFASTTLSAIVVKGGCVFATSVRGGVFRSSDGGESWFSASAGLTRYNVTSLASRGSIVFAGTDKSLVYRTTDNGNGWIYESPSRYITAGPISALAVLGNTLLAAFGVYDDSYVNYSSDDGATWGTGGIYGASGVSSFAVNGSDIFAATVGSGYNGTHGWGIYYSTNGIGWGERSSNIIPQNMSAIAVSGTNLWAAAWGGGGLIYRSTDYGLTWNPGSLGASAGNIASLMAAGGTVFAGTLGTGIYCSTDNGMTWTQCDTGLTNRTVFTLAAGGGDIFAGTADGIFVTTNSGGTWIAVNAGLAQSTIVTSFTVSETNLFAGTSSSGVWRRPLNEMITAISSRSKEAPVQYELAQNYPNPFNPSTTIRYALPARSHVTLTVFNTLGQSVATLVNEDQDGGYHTAEFNGSGLASGVYFYRLQAGEFGKSRRLVLLK
jgi:photosystem II stability/assembly factor-like uncharacterized protein